MPEQVGMSSANWSTNVNCLKPSMEDRGSMFDGFNEGDKLGKLLTLFGMDTVGESGKLTQLTVSLANGIVRQVGEKHRPADEGARSTTTKRSCCLCNRTARRLFHWG